MNIERKLVGVDIEGDQFLRLELSKVGKSAPVISFVWFEGFPRMLTTLGVKVLSRSQHGRGDNRSWTQPLWWLKQRMRRRAGDLRGKWRQ